MSDPARTYRTIRHLRPSQWYWRLRYRRESGRPAVAPQLPATLAVREDFPQGAAGLPGATGVSPVGLEERHWQDASGAQSATSGGHMEGPDADGQFVEQLERGRFVHLNEARDLGTDPMDWLLGSRDAGRLWTVTLHYHAWAWRLARLVRQNGPLSRRADRLLRRYLGDWITRCDLTVDGSRALAWNAYAVATRIGWWCRLYHLLGHEGRAGWGTLDSVFLESLWTQAAWLGEHVEWDLRANHLLRDAVGLAWAGRFFEGPRPRRWLQTATHLAVQQAEEQVLRDGGHFERSPMYHVEVMDDLLTLAVLVESDAARQQLRETWRKMAEFLAWAHHPDGQVALLNDGGFNGACTPAAMFAKGRELLGIEVDARQPVGGRLLADFGLAVWHGSPWSIFFDVGPVGVDYQPGHAHADTLAFEASYRGERLFVDPGTLRYDNDSSRRYDRSTASHNTVSIDDADSSEVWHIFRVGRRARPIDVEFEAAGDCFRAAGSHTGYDYLSGRPRHRRTVEIDPQGRLTVTDRFTGRGRHTVSGGLLVAPEWQITQVGDGWELRREGSSLGLSLQAPATVRPEIREAAYHPQYGLQQSTRRLVWRGELEFPGETILRIVPRESAYWTLHSH